MDCKKFWRDYWRCFCTMGVSLLIATACGFAGFKYWDNDKVQNAVGKVPFSPGWKLNRAENQLAQAKAASGKLGIGNRAAVREAKKAVADAKAYKTSSKKFLNKNTAAGAAGILGGLTSWWLGRKIMGTAPANAEPSSHIEVRAGAESEWTKYSESEMEGLHPEATVRSELEKLVSEADEDAEVLYIPEEDNENGYQYRLVVVPPASEESEEDANVSNRDAKLPRQQKEFPAWAFWIMGVVVGMNIVLTIIFFVFMTGPDDDPYGEEAELEKERPQRDTVEEEPVEEEP